MSNLLAIKNLNIKIEEKNILKNINLQISEKQIHAVVGPNGAGKSSLLHSIMGSNLSKTTAEEIKFLNEDIKELAINERSKKGIFLAWQNPQEIEGLNQLDYFKSIINAHREKPISLLELYKYVQDTIKTLNISNDFINRYLNVGFSGGEKKKNELLQMMFLKPKLCLLDEIDSGLDVEAVKMVAKILFSFIENNKCSIIVVGHNQTFFNYLKPTHLHIIINHQIISSEPVESLNKIQEEGYDWLIKKYNLSE